MIRRLWERLLFQTVRAVWMGLFLALPASAASFGEFTIRDELELARKFDFVIETRFPVVHDSFVTAYVRSLVDRLVAVMPPQPFPIQVTVVRNGSMNAFASAAGHITVFTGLLANLESEDELASVLAHELAHVSERHIARSIEKSQITSIGSLVGVLAGVLVGSQGNSKSAGALMTGAVAGAKALQLKYSRENEEDADQFGLKFLVDAGFAPVGMVSAFERLRKMQWLGGGGDVPSYLTTHPGMNERVGYMGERVAKLPRHVRNRAPQNAQFLRVRAIVQAWYDDPHTAMAVFSEADLYPDCLSRLGHAVAVSRLGRVEQARDLFSQAMACNPDDVLWQREFGRFSFEYGELSAAVRLLREAVDRDPRDLYSMFFYARALAEQGDYDDAIALMRKILKELPRDAEVLEYTGRYEGMRQRLFEAHVSFAKAFAYRRSFDKYSYHMRQAEAVAVDERQHRALRGVRAEIDEYRDVLHEVSR